MGNGRSKSSINRELIPVDDTYDGNPLQIDIDTGLNSKVTKDYEDDRLKFNMTEEELDDYLREHEDVVHIVYASDFYYFSGQNNVGDIVEDGPREGRVLIHDEDLRYTVYKMVEDLVKVQDAYRKATGDNVRLVNNLYVGCEIEDYEQGTRGYTVKTSVDTGRFRDFSWGKVAIETDSSDITVDARLNTIVRKKYIESLNKGKLDLSTEGAQNFLIERNSYQNGWFAITGAHQSTTLTHELGHATYTRLKSYMTNTKVGSIVKNWHENTRGDPVSGYAQRNYSESFAECFNLFIHGGHSNSQMYQEFVHQVAPALGISNMYGCVN